MASDLCAYLYITGRLLWLNWGGEGAYGVHYEPQTYIYHFRSQLESTYWGSWKIIFL